MTQSRLRSDFGKLAASLAKDGLRATLVAGWSSIRLRFHYWPDLRFDKRHSVDTSGVIDLDALSIESDNRAHGVLYDPSPVVLIRRMLKLLHKTLDLRNFVFVDFGSGKGRVVFLASKYPFRSVKGVEFAAELHDAAVINLRNFQSQEQHCSDLHFSHADATDFKIPEDRCVLYFYVPFHPPVMSKVVQNIEASYRAHPRKIYIVYAKPWFREILDEQMWISEVTVLRPWWKRFSPDPMDILIYETVNGNHD